MAARKPASCGITRVETEASRRLQCRSLYVIRFRAHERQCNPNEFDTIIYLLILILVVYCNHSLGYVLHQTYWPEWRGGHGAMATWPDNEKK